MAETVTIHRVTFLAPAQRFLTSFSVTRESYLSVVDEFALRFVAICRSVSYEDFAAFFGFSSIEATEVIRGLVSRDFIALPDGAIRLSPSGEQLFPRDGNEAPRIVNVEERTEHLFMDLFDFRLVDEQRGDASLGAGVLLDLPENFSSKNSPDRVAQALGEQFAEYARRRALGRDAQLYSVASVAARTRFQLPVDVDINLRRGANWSVELEFGDNRPAESRLRQAVHRWFDGVCGQQSDDQQAWAFITEIFPWAPRSPMGLAQALAEQSLTHEPDTMFLLGSASSPQVADQLARYLEDNVYGPEARENDVFCWMPAQSEFWFRSRSSWGAVDQIVNGMADDPLPSPVLVLRQPWSDKELFSLRKRFKEVRIAGNAVPSGVEIMLCPSSWCAVWAWLKGDGLGVPVPKGFVTTNRACVTKVTDILAGKQTG
jgi:hypothetical protein